MNYVFWLNAVYNNFPNQLYIKQQGILPKFMYYQFSSEACAKGFERIL